MALRKDPSTHAYHRHARVRTHRRAGICPDNHPKGHSPGPRRLGASRRRGSVSGGNVAVDAETDQLLRGTLLRTALTAVATNCLDHFFRKYLQHGACSAELFLGRFRIFPVTSVPSRSSSSQITTIRQFDLAQLLRRFPRNAISPFPSRHRCVWQHGPVEHDGDGAARPRSG